MADSLFDNRYRYDFIYPRGRSGETLRAVDTQADNRPVVIKRPAPNDAPPIRAGQEVSILNERKALTRLAGHPVLTEFLGSGQFFVGGVPHQYIVMERAEGQILADMVMELGAKGERLPQLELLVIVDFLLDLLQIAHARDIVYNDVDAKHLFWNRDYYRLQVIDWGNAVFLEGDEVTPQGISRQNDVYQVGELLYFVLSGGGRADIPRDADENFRLDFGNDGENISEHLQTIISRAVHPNTRLRYQTVGDLRRDLEVVRKPMEAERDATLNRVRDRLRRNLSKNELRGLLGTLEPLLAMDAGHPDTRQVQHEVINRSRDLDVSADLDAVRIYMESTNWSRASELLNELREKAGTQTASLVNLLLDCTYLLLDADLNPTPPAVTTAITLMFDDQVPVAARVLLTEDTPNDEARKLQWLMAERISSLVPEVLLLRPNLYRLDLALTTLAEETNPREAKSITRARRTMTEINQLLDDMPGAEKVELATLRDSYRAIVDHLTNLNKTLSTVAVQQHLSNRRLPLTSLERALNATMALADNMHVIGKMATSSPRDATVSLDLSRTIDPTNPLWNAISDLLGELYDLLQSYQTYVPSADGSDLEAWLTQSHETLAPFLERLFDEMLAGMVDGLQLARTLWQTYADTVITGNRIAAISALSRATDAVGTVSPTLAGWFNQLRNVVEGATYIERHAIFGGLGRALADGWEAFDRGRLADSERLAQQALDIARNDTEQGAVQRLLKLSKLAREWVDRNGVGSQQRSQTALTDLEALYTPDELEIRENFAKQMPSRETYLKAMNKGLVELYERQSTAAVRLLYFNNILLGALEAHDGLLDDARFWREAATRVLSIERTTPHIATRTLDVFITKREHINQGEALLNQVAGKHAINDLEKSRRQLEDNPEARLLAGGIHSLRETEAALRDWMDGEFRVAGLKLENALHAVNEVEQSADVTLTNHRAWLMDLQQTTAQLYTLTRDMRQAVERREAEPIPIVREAHHKIANLTADHLGDDRAVTLFQWRDTYENFLTAYTDQTIRRSAKLQRFNELFRAMFIDRHPAYVLYRHWYDLTENAPEFPAPPTDDPTPRLDEGEVQESAYAGSRYADEDTDIPSGARRLPIRALMLAILVLALVIAGIVFIIASGNNDDGDDNPITVLDITATSDASVVVNETEDMTPVNTDVPLNDSTSIPADFNTPTLATPSPEATNTSRPTNTPRPPSNTPTPLTPTHTPTETISPTPSITSTPSITPTPTLPEAGLQGQQDIFETVNRLSESPFDASVFALDETDSWRLGVGTLSDEEEIHIVLPTDLMNTMYGNNAPTRIRRSEALMVLTTYQPQLLESNEVFFGMMFQSVDDPSITAGLEIEVADTNAVNLWLRNGEERQFIRQSSVNVITPRIRLERDPGNGAITVFMNEQQIGTPIPFIPPDDAIQPVLFVQNGGVIVNVSIWQVNLR